MPRMMLWSFFPKFSTIVVAPYIPWIPYFASPSSVPSSGLIRRDIIKGFVYFPTRLFSSMPSPPPNCASTILLRPLFFCTRVLSCHARWFFPWSPFISILPFLCDEESPPPLLALPFDQRVPLRLPPFRSPFGHFPFTCFFFFICRPPLLGTFLSLRQM